MQSSGKAVSRWAMRASSSDAHALTGQVDEWVGGRAGAPCHEANLKPSLGLLLCAAALPLLVLGERPGALSQPAAGAGCGLAERPRKAAHRQACLLHVCGTPKQLEELCNTGPAVPSVHLQPSLAFCWHGQN